MSSDSFHGPPVDIIDLDRYMRVSVLPSRQRHVQRCGDLIVDAGGAGVQRAVSSGEDSFTPAPQHKRYSHDSGVSDGSYIKRRQRHKHNVERDRSRDHSRYESASAMSQFRVNCEQALLEQQKQISRLAELCERLVPETKENSDTNNRVRSKSCSNKEYSRARKTIPVRTNQLVSESSETSISSESSKDVRRKTRRSESCKTYKIMMDRLEDLSRVLTNRKPQTAVVSKPYPSSVVVCNKLVATEPDRFGKQYTTVRKIVYENGESESLETERSRKERLLGATRAQVLDITPALVEHTNMATERVIRRSSSSGTINHLDLDNPIHFYEQAKRLQTLHTSTKHHGHRATLRVTESVSERDATLCALCRTYWRAVRNCIVQTFGSYT
ncbi:uncharacterized protein LOC121739900 [Aricia agestis]|uniref:uncharacterized protein LOC121739900 n=1 Tax=Aricia agestis TaxID=91739 RepID=UPI001C20B432|nr:uncharacterized protein LOC121739900 [Aricia agestis]